MSAKRDGSPGWSGAVRIRYSSPSMSQTRAQVLLMTEQHLTLCTSLKHLGFSQGNEMKLYGEQFELLGEPIFMADNLVVVDAIEQKSKHLRRVRIPLPL